MAGGTGARDGDTPGAGLPTRVTLTTDRATADAAGPLADALRAADVAVARRAFLPVPHPEDLHPWGALLLAADSPPLPLTLLVAPAMAPPGVTAALAAALGVGHRQAPATLQLKAAGVFVSIRARDSFDIASALGGLPAQLARLGAGRGERRLVYGEGTWRIDP